MRWNIYGCSLSVKVNELCIQGIKILKRKLCLSALIFQLLKSILKEIIGMH